MTGSDPLVTFEGVRKTFDTPSGPLVAVDDLSFAIDRGEFLAVLGPSGCGKSTLMLAMAGLTQATAGSVHIDGDVVEAPFTDLGIVFQESELLGWRTALDNVLLQAEIRRMDLDRARTRAIELLSSVGLGGFEGAYPDELSGGMQQRVAICRALVHDPRILAMDEPFGALDALTRDQLQLDLQSLRAESDKTVMFITHSIEEAVFLADRVLVFTPRPASIASEVQVPFERPRTNSIRRDPRFGELVSEIRDTFENLGVLESWRQDADG